MHILYLYKLRQYGTQTLCFKPGLLWNKIPRIDKRNDNRFNNRGHSLFSLMGIFLNHLRLIPNILKRQDCKIFTKLVPSQTLLRSKGVFKIKKRYFKNLQKFTGKHLCWSLFVIKLQAFRPATSLNSDSNTDVFL